MASTAEPVTETHRDLITADKAATTPGRYEVRRIIEAVQDQPDVMAILQDGDVRPGVTVELGMVDGAVVAISGAHSTELSDDIAHGISVRPV
nr:hypothetical protein [Nakamurella aerolata]